MKALSLSQPWASLVACGAKQVETRSWRTPYRGLLAIHAAKGYPAQARYLEVALPYRKHLHPPLPLGCVLAVAQLLGCYPTADTKSFERVGMHVWGPDEAAFGDYTPGRWMWLLDDVVALPEPIPARGSLGLWDWEPPVGWWTEYVRGIA